jgi:hypothetical protein
MKPCSTRPRRRSWPRRHPQYLVYREDGAMQTEEDYDRFIAVVERLIAHLL